MNYKKWDYTIPLLLIVLGVAILVSSCNIKYFGQRHVCKYDLCPYKGINPDQWNNSVKKYTEDSSFTDSWCVDITHLQHPDYTYDQIDSVLFSPMLNK